MLMPYNKEFLFLNTHSEQYFPTFFRLWHREVMKKYICDINYYKF